MRGKFPGFPPTNTTLQICTKSFVGWGFAPDPLGELTDSLSGIGGRASRERDGGRGGGKEGWEGKGGEGVPECPNPELASLRLLGITCNEEQTMSTLFAESSSDIQ